MTTRNLDFLFKPCSIAIVGSGQDDQSADALLQLNLIKAGFTGPVMPVNPKRRAVAGVLTYPDVDQLPESPNLAILTGPLQDAPRLIHALGERGTKAVLLTTSEVLKLSEASGAALGQAILNAAKPHLLRVIGPDRLGIAVPHQGVNATLAHQIIHRGTIALLSQSSAIAGAVINWAYRRHIGFSYIVAMGVRLDVDFSDALDYVIQDGHTQSVLLYLERIRNPRKFLSAARVAARVKPVIVLKPRFSACNDSGSEAVIEDAIYDAAFRRAGLLRVDTIGQLFNSVETLATTKTVRQNRLLIVGNSRSVALLASDMLRRQGGVLATVREETKTALSALCSAYSHVDNPVDLGDNATVSTYESALKLLLKEPEADGLLIVHVPRLSPLDEAIAQVLITLSADSRRLLMVSWVGETAAAPARQRLREAGIATYATPDEAAQAFVRVAEYRHNQDLLMETPRSTPEEFTPDITTARQILQNVLVEQRPRLHGYEIHSLLNAYGIPMVETRFARTPEEAAELAQRFKGDIALKIISPQIRNHADVGGIALALDNPEEVFHAANLMLRRIPAILPEAIIEGFALQPMLSRQDAYEVTIGVRTSRFFGASPVLRFGHGGVESEVIDDFAYALPPLNMHLAVELMSRTRLYRAMKNKSRSVDLEALALTLIKVSQLVVDHGELVDMDLNPLWVKDDGVLVLNATVRVADTGLSAHERLAIHPYPKELEETVSLPNGQTLFLRPILPEDEPSLQDFVRRMPLEDKRMRFFQPIKELTHTMAARLTQLDYDREMAIIIAEEGVPGKATIFGVVRMSIWPDRERAEYAIAVDRCLRGQGVGPLLMKRIINYAKQRAIKELFGTVLRENEPMLRLNRSLGFTVESAPDDPGVVYARLPL